MLHDCMSRCCHHCRCFFRFTVTGLWQPCVLSWAWEHMAIVLFKPGFLCIVIGSETLYLFIFLSLICFVVISVGGYGSWSLFAMCALLFSSVEMKAHGSCLFVVCHVHSCQVWSSPLFPGTIYNIIALYFTTVALVILLQILSDWMSNSLLFCAGFLSIVCPVGVYSMYTVGRCRLG